MPKMIFINLPVTDVARSTAFYEALGGTVNPQFSNESVSSMAFSETITIMLLSHDHLRQFSSKQIVDAAESIEVLTTLAEDSREAADAAVARAVSAGGREDRSADQDMGFLYSRRVEDPDGHTFNLMHLDLEAMRGMGSPTG